MEPTELVDGFSVGFEIKRSQGCPEVELPLTEVGKTARRRFWGDVRSLAGHVGFEIPTGPSSRGGEDADR